MKLSIWSSAFTALALAAMVTTTAHASVIYTSAGIVTSSTGELTSPSYTGVTNNFSSETGGYNFVYVAGSIGGAPGSGPICGSTATCAASQFGSGAGGSGSAGGVGMWAIPTNTTILGPNGAFLALDSDFNTASTSNNGEPVTETLTGLVANDFYTITFNAADTQQNTYNGPSEDQVQVCLGSSCGTTALVTDLSDSDTPWVAESFTFQASGTSEALTLLGIGGTNPPSGTNVPAFALVDDLSVTQTPPIPEPNSLLLLSTGLLGLGGYMRMRIKSAASKA